MTVATAAPPVSERVTQVLQEFFDHQPATPLAAAIRRFAASGKRLRPAFCYWGWHGVADAGDDDNPAVIAGAALELFHCFALIHDDIIDDSGTRRGHPSCHEEFARWHPAQDRTGDAQHFGRSAALLCGDLCASWAVELFGEACRQLSTERTYAAQRLFALARAEAITGEFLDITADVTAGDAVETALEIVRLKTARYSIARPLQIGATLAGADQQLISELERFGDLVGEAFQLRDDILGTFGDPQHTGKSADADLRQAKPTVLLALALHHASDRQAGRMRELLRKPELTLAEAGRIRQIVIRTGALAETEQLITAGLAQAIALLDSLDMADEARSSLRELTELATTRRR